MSSFGTLFKVTTFGESHCAAVGCIVEGIPPRMHFTPAQIQQQLNRRRPGQSVLTTARAEKDKVEVMSGMEGNYTLGTPICLLVRNEDQRPHDYHSMADIPRPSHADFTYQAKYGIRASSGGGRASARETIGRVAAGAIAEMWLTQRFGVEIIAYVSAVGQVSMSHLDQLDETQIVAITRERVDASAVRCPDEKISEEMSKEILAAKADNDSIGGVVTCICRNVPAGLGEPVFDKLEAMLAHAMMSIPATKGFEIGSGFGGASLRGSQHNDSFYTSSSPSITPSSSTNEQRQHVRASYEEKGKLRTKTNFSGGIQGGITNGEDIIMRIAFKPPATIGKAQETVDFDGLSTVLRAEGRHDPCVVPRAVPIVEAMAALVIADATLIQLSRVAASQPYELVGKVSTK